MKKKEIQIHLTLLFFVSLMLRLIRLILDPVLLRDSALYLYLADKWVESGDYGQTIMEGTIVPPFPLYLIKSAILWGFTPEIAGRSIAIFCSCLIPLVGYLITKELGFKANAAFICGLVLTINPILIAMSIQPMRENQYLLFTGMTCYTFIRGIKHIRLLPFYLVLCALFSTLAFFSRYEALENSLFILMTICLLCLTRRMALKNTIVYICIYTFTFAFVCYVVLLCLGFDASFISNIFHRRDIIGPGANIWKSFSE